jgi:integrase/recombinase XerD
MSRNFGRNPGASEAGNATGSLAAESLEFPSSHAAGRAGARREAVEAGSVAPESSLPETSTRSDADHVPTIVSEAGSAARFAWEEFLFGRIRNEHTRRAYRRAILSFLDWCDDHGLKLHQIAPRDVGVYLDGSARSTASKKVDLAALRHFFDQLVTRHVVVLNPAASVRAERLVVVEGKTPEITVEQARALLASVDTSHAVGLRDRAIIATLIYTAARVGALARLRRSDFYDSGDQYCFRFTEKGGKSREIPVRHDLQWHLIEYLVTADLMDSRPQTPLFLSAVRRTKRFSRSGMTAGDIGRMVKRRMRDAGLPTRLCPHSFRVATVTNLLEQNIPLEDVQHLAGHADPRTTRLYDRRQRRVTRNIVERISI